MKKIKMSSLALCVVLVLSLAFTGCSNQTASPSPKNTDSAQKTPEPSKDTKDTEETYKLKCGVMVNKDQAQTKGALYFADKVKEATNGKVIIDVFSDGVLGSETDVWEAIQAGTVDMGIISPAYVGNFVPEYQIYELPFLFASREHRDKVVNGPVGEKIDKLLADKVGMIVLGQFGGIGRNLITRTKKIETLDDIKGVKMRVYSSPIVVDTWTALGTVPVTVAYAEAYTGLQTGVVDAAENEMATLVSQKWYEPCKYVAITEHNINTRPLIIGKSQLEKLPKEYQEIMIEVGKDAASYAVKTERDDDAKYIDDLKNLNIEVFELQDKDKWIEATKQLRSDFVKKYNMEAILSEIEGLK